MHNTHHLTRYNKFISSIQALSDRDLTYYEVHHIIPKCMGGDDSPNNLVALKFREHFLAHWMLYMAYPSNQKLANAFHYMCNVIDKVPARRREMRLEHGLTSRAFERLKLRLRELGNPTLRGIVNCIDLDTGEKVKITSFEFVMNPGRYQFHTKGMVGVVDRITEQQHYVSKDTYQQNKEKYMTHTAANLDNATWTVFDPIAQTTQKMKYSEFCTINQSRNQKDKLLKVIAHKVSVITETGERQTIDLKNYNPLVHTHHLSNKISVLDLVDNTYKSIDRTEYNAEPSRYQTSTKGKVLAFDTVEQKSVLIDKKDFDKSRYVGQTKNLTTVFDKVLGEYAQITREQARDKSRYQGPCSGKQNVIDMHTGKRQQINSTEFDSNTHIKLGDKKYYFKALYKPKNKIKNIHIYEWNHINQADYEIQDLDLFGQLQQTYLK